MKVIYFLAALLAILQVRAQQPTGRVVYEFTRQMQFRVTGSGGPDQPPPPPRTRVIKKEVLFGNNQMLRRALEENNLAEVATNEGGVQAHVFGFGDDDVTWLNFADGRRVEQREFAAKQFLVSDSVRKMNWKLTGESKTILGYSCQQATTTRASKRMSMNMNNGVMTRTEIPDTSQVTVWFTTAIPVSAGPEYEGQLPGLILQIEVNGNPTYKAVEISQKVDVAAIKEPKKGKKVTAAEFTQERDKLMQEMRPQMGRRPMNPGS